MCVPGVKSCNLAFLFLMACTCATAIPHNFNITLNKPTTPDNKELYGAIVSLIGNSTMRVNLNILNKKIDYIIFQVHTFAHTVTLYNNTDVQESRVSGTNLGMFGPAGINPDTYYIRNDKHEDVRMYISIHGYRKSDPIAGGCNMEFALPTSPFMGVSYDENVVTVFAPAARMMSAGCDYPADAGDVEFYRMYLPEWDLREDTYFDGIRKMITREKIKENGIKVPMLQTLRARKRQVRSLGAYPGTGSIYVAVATRGSAYSVYAPTYTYACNPLDQCDVYDDFMTQFFCAWLLFVGLFVCFLGHRFFKTEMFLVGMFAGIIMTFILLSIWTDLDRPALLSTSVICGVLFGAGWLLLWWSYGLPALSVSLVAMQVGFILAAITYHGLPDDNLLMRYDSTFWVIFLIIVFATSIISLLEKSNMFCCAILGAFAVVFSLDHYTDSNMKYIIINTVRRSTVKRYNNVILAPPFQKKDILLTILWAILSMAGFMFQHCHNKDRRPYPAPPRGNQDPYSYGTYGRDTRRENIRYPRPTLNETSPLLSGNVIPV